MILLYLRVSVPTSLALKSTFIDSKRVQFLLGCPKAQMHGTILATTRHGGHFPNSAILSSTFLIPYSVFRVLLTPFTYIVCVYMCMYVCTVCIIYVYLCMCMRVMCVCSREISYCFKYIIIHNSLYTIAV